MWGEKRELARLPPDPVFMTLFEHKWQANVQQNIPQEIGCV